MNSLLEWTAAIAWPCTVVTIALLYRGPIYALLENIGEIADRATKQPFKMSVGSFEVDFKEAVVAKDPKSVDEAISAAADIAKDLLPFGVPVPNKSGFVTSPYAPTVGYVDVRGFPSGTEVGDPFTSKRFLVP